MQLDKHSRSPVRGDRRDRPHYSRGMIRIGSPSAIEKQVDQLETVLSAFLVTVLVVLLAAANASKDFEIFGAKVETADAFGPVTYIFDGVFLVLGNIIWKIGDMLRASEPAEMSEAIASLFIHKWIFNPFSFTGTRSLSVLNSSVGTALLTLAWWVGLAALKLLSGVSSANAKDTTILVLLVMYVAFGLLALCTCIRLFRILYLELTANQTLLLPPNREIFLKAIRASIVVKLASFLAASILGYELFYAFGHIGA